MNFFTDPLAHDESFCELVETLRKRETPVTLHGAVQESVAHLVYSLHRETAETILLVTEDEGRAKTLVEDMNVLSEGCCEFYPYSEENYYPFRPIENAAEYQRLAVLRRLCDGEKFVAVTTIAALRRKISKPRWMKEHTRIVDLDTVLDLREMSQFLVESGYEKTSMVETNGQFSIRGGILDIYPVGYENPVRVDMYDDEIDSIKSFDTQTQRSIDRLERVEIFPARELILTPKQKRDVINGLKKDIEKYEANPPFNIDAEKAIEKYSRVLAFLEEDMPVSNTDLVVAYIKKTDSSSLLDYFDEDAILYTEDIARLYDGNTQRDRFRQEEWTRLFESGEIFPSQMDLSFSFQEILTRIKKRRVINGTLLLKRTRLLPAKSIHKITTKEAESYNRNLELFTESMSDLIHRGYKVVIFSSNEEESRLLSELLQEKNLISKIHTDANAPISSHQIHLYPANFTKGFEYPSIKMLFLTHREIYGVNRRGRRVKSRRRKRTAKDIINYADLNIGDYVVHENHGIGQYIGIEQIVVQDVTRDYLVISYRGNDKLYIPTEQMNLIQKYVAGQGVSPRVNKLGGTEWTKAKYRAKKAVNEIAQDLVDLYAKRAKQEGHAFSPDTPWQKEFEESFVYEETYSQLRSVAEIKKDMESIRPMDRLLCGDVGYGKTEVALRAAFKAVMDGKQVAFLVPTTILAQQHYNTMTDRFRDYPLKVEMISRFRTPMQQKKILQDTKKGFVDILVGTHRLLSKDLQFKDLGLLIVDEEQRFGVRHKEKLKSLKENIDVLTLSATPIPRTLQMGLVGIRDVSTLDEPPEERSPIITYVMEYDAGIVRDAINKEIDRGGQVYFVYNRVSNIETMAEKIQALVPSARIAIGHGQMQERELENVMLDFHEGKYDVLLCTTIIETGMDIQNVNTMIVYDAERLGLAQLYQLKGRIGRSDRSSYAYFTYEKGKSLSEISEKRLMAIRDFTEFGSGFKIAMRDLELRGAGNLLGESQHGHIDAVGYDFYVRLLEEAVLTAKGETAKVVNDISVDIVADGYIPDSYIRDQGQKIDMYKKIASMEVIEDYDEIIEELLDRFGDIPKPVVNIMDISIIKALAQASGFTSVKEIEDTIVFEYEDVNTFSLAKLKHLVETFDENIEFDLSKNPSLKMRIQKDKLKEATNLVYIIYCLQKDDNEEKTEEKK